jgi:hypothetical protein
MFSFLLTRIKVWSGKVVLAEIFDFFVSSFLVRTTS